MPHIEYMASHYRAQLAREQRARRDALIALMVTASLAFVIGMVSGMALMVFGP